MRTLLPLAAAAVAVLVLGACGGDDERTSDGLEGSPTTPPIVASATISPATGTPTVTSTLAQTPTPTAAAGIPARSVRDIDFRSTAVVRDLLAAAGGGELNAERVRYVDLTGDGVEEAVVPIGSGGTQGDIGVAVYRVSGGTAERAFFRKLAGRVEVRGETLVLTDGVYERGDPACGPSRLEESVYGWDGRAFVERSRRVVPNPDFAR